jgi:hypothetical protein
MTDHIIAFLQDARRLSLEQKDAGQNSRELSIVLTHIDTAILWRQEDLRLKAEKEVEYYNNL